MMKVNEADLEVGRIEIYQFLDSVTGEPYVSFNAQGIDGEELGIVTVLGMLELSKDTALRMGDKNDN